MLYAATGDTVETGSGDAVETDTSETLVYDGFGTISIEQSSPIPGIFSEWTIIKPGSVHQSGRHKNQVIENSPAGFYTLIVNQLAGATAEVKVYRNDELTVDNARSQASFIIENGDVIKIEIKNIFTRVGVVSVQSNPSGLSFSIEGPNGYESKGITPKSFIDVPEGLYSATFDEIPGCVKPRPISDRLQKDSRITLSLTVSCEGIESNEETQSNLQFVNATIDGFLVTFTDVPINTWFATYVHSALKTGVVSGYKNDDGHPSGLYGPTDYVTLAQLAKIAHSVASIDVSSMTRQPLNIRARDTWFSKYFASAEQLGWYVFSDSRTDPNRNATRGEVVATLLQALDVPREWPKADLFTDIKFDTPYASSIETAASDGLISGYANNAGTLTGEFGPENPINRAEMAKVITLAIDMYTKDTPDIQPEVYE